MENVITLGKLIGLLLYCSLPPSSLFFFARPVMETIFLVLHFLLSSFGLCVDLRFMDFTHRCKTCLTPTNNVPHNSVEHLDRREENLSYDN